MLRCGSISGIKCKIHKLPTSCADIEHVWALVPWDACFGGHTNTSVLYVQCTGDQLGYYLDVNSMYSCIMSASQFFYPICHPVILKQGRDDFLPLDNLFGLIWCWICPQDDLSFPINEILRLVKCFVIWMLCKGLELVLNWITQFLEVMSLKKYSRNTISLINPTHC